MDRCMTTKDVQALRAKERPLKAMRITGDEDTESKLERALADLETTHDDQRRKTRDKVH